MEEHPTEQKTRCFKRDRPIDCRDWLQFEIVEETYRYRRIRYTKTVDIAADGKVECEISAEKPTENPE